MILNEIKKSKTIILIATFTMVCLLAAIWLPGCKSSQIIVEETQATETVEEKQSVETIKEDEAEEEKTKETEEEEDIDLTEDFIPDNINMLSGLEISGSVQNFRPLAIMVQNSPKARPHSGLIYADMVFEVVAEGGVTRYVTLFSSNDADIIGPVRSARIQFMEIARSFDPIYTFWGTYPEGYDAMKRMDMDVLDANSDRYVPYTSAGWRDPSRADALEHTAFIDTHGIKRDAAKFGYSLEGGQSPMAFKIDAPESQRGNISNINVDFSSSSYIVDFLYDKSTNKYLKWLAKEPHVDFETGQPITLSNVIVLITDMSVMDSAGRMNVRTTGKHSDGEAYYFMDGDVIEGTWARGSIFDPFEFNDAEGNKVLFNRGSTWVCIIPGIERLDY